MKTIKLFAILLFAASLYSCQLEGGPLKPNIIYIMADDLGYGDLGYNGQTKIKTPNIDRMAEEGMVFTSHYTGSAVCGPSRAVLMTGFHTGHCVIRGNPAWTKSGNPMDLGKDDVTVADELKRAGYTTGIVGKWGLAENLTDGVPNKQGFDYFYGFNKHKAAHHYYPEQIWENEAQFTLEGNDSYNKKGKYSHYLFTEKAVDFIEKNHKEPFFLYLAYTIPHYELTIPEKEKAQYKNLGWAKRSMKAAHYRHDEDDGHITYASMVSLMDKDVGFILDKLKELGVDENTLVVFTSDNGHEYDNVKDEFFNSNGDYQGKKRDLYEGGIHCPFVAYWPYTIKGGSKTDLISAFWDFLPTACELAGIEPTDNVDGISYAPTLLGKDKKQKKHDYLYWEFNERYGPVQAIRKDNWKALKYKKKPIELYNLSFDVEEENNLARQNSEKAKEMLYLINNTRTEHPEFPLIKKVKKKN